MTLVRLNPNPFSNFVREFDEAFGNFGRTVENGHRNTWSPSVDVVEDKDNFTLTVELPGMSKKDLSINYEDGQLTVSGERKYENTDEGNNYLRREIRYGKFSRSFKVTTDIKIDDISATFKDGLLSITLPKAEEAKPRAIEVKVK